MPNHDVRIVYRSTRTLQASVLMMNSDVHFLNDGVAYHDPSC